MQILNRTIKLSGTEKADIPVGMKVHEGLVFVIENRGPGQISIREVGVVEPNSFIVLGGVEEILIHPPSQFTTVDVTVYTK
jgi:hypothetical protein